MSRPLIVYGNCQSHVVACAFLKVPDIAERFRVLFVPSYDLPGAEPTRIDPEAVAGCAVFLEQKGLWKGFPRADLLPADAVRLSFPTLVLNQLWPLQGKDPRNTGDAAFPFGRYPYGDRLINRLLEQGLSGQALLDAYMATDLSGIVDLGRFADIEEARIRKIDARCDLPLGGHVLDRFRQRRLFWSYNHPSGDLLRDLAALLAEELSRRCGLPTGTAAEVAGTFAGWEPNAELKVAVHPQVADFFGLEWTCAGIRYSHYGRDGLGYHDYMRHLAFFD